MSQLEKTENRLATLKMSLLKSFQGNLNADWINKRAQCRAVSCSWCMLQVNFLFSCLGSTIVCIFRADGSWRS